MTSSIREHIIDNLITAIKTVKKSAGYDNDISDGRVFRAAASVDTNAFPSVYVFEGDELIVEREHAGSATRIFKDMDVLVEVWVSDYDDLSVTINSIEADVIKAIMADTTRGGYAVTTEQTGSTPFFLDGSNIGGRIISFNIRYGHRESDPYTA